MINIFTYYNLRIWKNGQIRARDSRYLRHGWFAFRQVIFQWNCFGLFLYIVTVYYLPVCAWPEFICRWFYVLDTEKVYLASITDVLRSHGKDYPMDLRVQVMGTIPINTATIIIKELGMDMDPVDLLAEFHDNQIVRMENVPFMPGLTSRISLRFAVGW